MLNKTIKNLTRHDGHINKFEILLFTSQCSAYEHLFLDISLV